MSWTWRNEDNEETKWRLPNILFGIMCFAIFFGVQTLAMRWSFNQGVEETKADYIVVDQCPEDAMLVWSGEAHTACIALDDWADESSRIRLNELMIELGFYENAKQLTPQPLSCSDNPIRNEGSWANC